MSASLTLSQLVDLALGTPEVGSVNFNVLHSLLHTMIQKLGIGDVKTEIPKSDRDFLTRRRDEPDAFSSAGTDVSDKDSAITGFTDDSSRKAPYHQLEDKVAKLEKQFQELHELPTNRDLYERAKLKGEGERPTPVSDMWQTMQLKNRVDANEAGIGKLMSLVQDLMSDMQRLKDDMQTLKDENKEIRNRLDDVKDMNELLKRLKDLEDLSKSLEDKIKGLPGPEAFNDYVSWAALEDALRGLREGLDELNSREPPAPPAPAERIVIEMSSQTTPRSSRPNSSRPASARGPSEELQHLLEKLGKLTDRHDKLEDRVDVIEDELKKKLDKSALEGLNLGVPDEVLQKLKALQEEIDKLKKNLGRVKAIEAIVTELQMYEQCDRPSAVSTFSHYRPESVIRVSTIDEHGGVSDPTPTCPRCPSSALTLVMTVDKIRPATPPSPASQTSPESIASPSATLVPVERGVIPVVSRRFVLEDQFRAFCDRVDEMVDSLNARGDALSQQHGALSARVSAEVARLEEEIRALRESLRTQLGLLENGLEELEDKLSSRSMAPPPAAPPRAASPPQYRAQTPPPDYSGAPPPTQTPRTPTLPPISGGVGVEGHPALLAEMQDLLARHATLIEKQRAKHAQLTEDTNRSLGEAQGRLRGLDTALQALAQRLDELALARVASSTTAQRPEQTEVDTPSRPLDEGVSGSQVTLEETTKPLVETPSLSLPPTSVNVGAPVDSEAFSRMQQNLANLQFELARLDKITHRLVDQNTSQQNSLDELYKLCSQLDEHKANKEFVQTEVDVKADKKLVDGKVNRSLFDSTCEDINKMIQDILAKLAASDEDWQRMRNQLTEDLDGKLDRLEFGPIRDELERQLRALAKRLKDMNRDYDYLEDDAAGIRKQLVQRFHCISCDRPVDMMPQGPVPSLPSPNGLPATRSARPYTTFELEQIRQHAKSLFTYQEKLPIYATSGMPAGREPFATLKSNSKKMSNFERAILENRIARCHLHELRAYLVHFGKDFAKYKGPPLKVVSQPNAEMIDAYQTSRACGGNHTLTYPHRRTARATHLNADQPVTSSEQQKQTEKFWSRKSNLFRDDTEVTVIPTYKNEIDIQGADGHIYRGRGGLPKLPPGSASSGMAKNPPMLPHRAQTSLGEAGRNTPPPASPRPTSARNSRPMSARHSPSPNAQPSSQPMVQLPRDEEAPRPPPAPSPSEPDNTSAPVE